LITGSEPISISKAPSLASVKSTYPSCATVYQIGVHFRTWTPRCVQTVLADRCGDCAPAIGL
jgi:hypothetical protein